MKICTLDCLGLQQSNQAMGAQFVNPNFTNSVPDLSNQYLQGRNFSNRNFLNSNVPFQTIEDTINSFDHLPKMRSSISLQNLHQVELASSDEELAYYDRNRRSSFIKNPTNLTEMHYLQSELSRKYEDSKEIETHILGHVPSILESGRMASTRSDIDHNLKRISLSYERRCKLRQDLRTKLNLPNLVPSMTFDRFHNLVPANEPPRYTENSEKKGPNIIKLDNMHIEVSNEIMAMIYYRALKGKFEQSNERETPLRKSKSFPSAKETPKIKEQRKQDVESKQLKDLSLITTSDYEDSFLDSGSETDLSTLEIGMTREMRIRSLKRYSPRHHNTMLPVLETENENTPDVEIKHTKTKKRTDQIENSILQFDDINEPVPPPAPEIRIQKIANVHKIETTIPDILKSQKLESKLNNFVVGYDKIKQSEELKRKKMALNDEIDLEKRIDKRASLEKVIKEKAHLVLKEDQKLEQQRKTEITKRKVNLPRQETTEVLKDKNDELKRNLIQLESKLEIIRDKKMDNIEDHFTEIKRSASSEIHKKLSSDAINVREILKSRKCVQQIDPSTSPKFEQHVTNPFTESTLQDQIEAARHQLDIIKMEELEHKLIHESHDPWINTPEKEFREKDSQKDKFLILPPAKQTTMLDPKLKRINNLNISDTARKHLGIKDKNPDVIKRYTFTTL